MPKPDTPDPDKLIRQTDGRYATADARFVVEQANGSWFLADNEIADDFGQPRVAGPIATLKLVKEAIPRVRSGPTPLRRPIKQAKSKATPAPTKETWIDRLPTAEKKRAMRLIRTLTGEGLEDAEALARALIEGGAMRGSLARRILEARIGRLTAAADDAGRNLVGEALALVSSGGRIGADLPGWALVETDPNGSPTDRRVELD